MSAKPPTDDRETRRALFEAGHRLADRALEELTPAIIAGEAGLQEGSFNACFPNMQEYFFALHQYFLSMILKQVITSLSGLPPGAERLQAGIKSFLDGCLQHHGLRLLLLQMDDNPQLVDVAHKRRKAFMEMLRLEFKSAGSLHSEAAARLFRVMVEETALAELEAWTEVPQMRHILWKFLRADAW